MLTWVGWGEPRVVGTMPDLEDRLWAVLVPVPSGQLEGVTPEKGLRAERAWAAEEGAGQEGVYPKGRMRAWLGSCGAGLGGLRPH